jgi:hypothetical protein
MNKDNGFKYDYAKVEPDFLNNMFLERVKHVEANYALEILNDPIAKEKLDKNCFNVAFAASATLKKLDMFNALYEHLPKDDKTLLNHTFSSKIFNLVCASSESLNSVKRLKELDKKFGLSKKMMEDSSSINEIEISKVETPLYPPGVIVTPIYNGYEEEFEKSWNEHGFIAASKNGNDKLINYLFSVSDNIPKNILEAGFISACKANQFETVLNIYFNLGNIGQSQLIQSYINSIDNYDDGNNETRKTFLSKLIMKEKLENELPLKENTKPNSQIKI